MVNSINDEKIDPKEFWSDLRRRVNRYFKDNQIKKTATAYYYFKGAIMAMLLWFPLVALVMFDMNVGVFLLMWLIMGIGKAGVGMNVMHDANHESVSKKKSVNMLLGASMYLLSGNVFNWKVQHNVLHHTYTNLHGKDGDINPKGVLRFHAKTPYSKKYKYQMYYAPLLYAVSTLNWVLYKDFGQLFEWTKSGITKQMKTTQTKELIILILSKIAYLSVFIGLPLWSGYSIGMILLGFVIMHAATGLILTFIFQMAHIVNEVEHPLDSEMNVTTNFAVHQLSTTSNFATNNKLLTFFSGGLNFQVEHHLFPGICHVHYPRISKIVKETAKEYGVKYHEHDTFIEALRSHMLYLKKLGTTPA